MSKYTQHVKYLGICGVVTEPVGGDQAARLVALSADAIARGAVLIPAKGGDVYVKFGGAAVDAAGDDTDDLVVVHGQIELVEIPPGSTHLSVATDALTEFSIPVQAIN